ELGVELALDDDVLAVCFRRVAVARLDDHGAVHARGDVLEDHGRAAVVHEHARVVQRELELDRLAGRDGAVLVLRRDHRGMEVHRMHHRRGGHPHAGHRLVAAVRHREADLVADARVHGRARHLVAEGPGAVLHARGDLDDLVRVVEPDGLHGVRVERLQFGPEAERGAFGEGAGVALVRDLGRLGLEVHLREVVGVLLLRLLGLAGAERGAEGGHGGPGWDFHRALLVWAYSRSAIALRLDADQKRTMTVRAMRLQAAHSPLVLETLPDPRPGRGEVLLEVAACGVCRTDLHIADGELPGARWPLTPGHEVVGRVLEAGEGAARFARGDRVGVPWLAWTCNACEYCRTGRENLCERARFTGFHVPGGYATHALADERYCVPIPARYGDAEAAPLLCAGLIGYRSYAKAGEARSIGLYGFGAAAHILAQVARADGRSVFAFTRRDDVEGQ